MEEFALNHRKFPKFYYWGEKTQDHIPHTQHFLLLGEAEEPGLFSAPAAAASHGGTQGSGLNFLSAVHSAGYIQHPEMPGSRLGASRWVPVFKREPFAPDRKGQLPIPTCSTPMGLPLSVESPQEAGRKRDRRTASSPKGPPFPAGQLSHHMHLWSSSQGRKDTLEMLETRRSLLPDVILHGTQIT